MREDGVVLAISGIEGAIPARSLLFLARWTQNRVMFKLLWIIRPVVLLAIGLEVSGQTGPTFRGSIEPHSVVAGNLHSAGPICAVVTRISAQV